MGYGGLRAVPKPYPTGGAHPVDDDWRRRVQEALDRKGWKRNKLAQEIGCDPSAITVVMRSSTVQSRLKPAIDKALEIEDPALEQLDADLLRAVRTLDDDMKRHLLGIAEKLAGSPRGTPRG